MSTFLTKSDIITAKNRVVEFEVKEWGGVIGLSPLSIEQRMYFDEKYFGEDGKLKEDQLKNPELIFDLLSMCLKNEDGTPMFSKEDIRISLGCKEAMVIHKIFYKCIDLVYLKKEAAEIIKKK